ncbi:hypothetical protein NJB1907f44_19470 [Mycobacterium marinum]|nr:hypothetical protein [Mycobacterium marinum]BBC68427.1 hypothetical protein MMRN_53230 [Mycobacterium marinum]GJN99416.1 hypothetical protein NJB1907f34b_12850 [Mycobacterium marinum]GJO05726.1 hypothetical protein NJB1907E90_16070 [Mycobacterium marinum]GJO06310.1 hypothetical protein NJB1808e29_35330 [Mycobacterium marinum]GJO14234.1 hypothetical protein NJB1907E11_11040 [Mycobacterium marinum]
MASAAATAAASSGPHDPGGALVGDVATGVVADVVAGAVAAVVAGGLAAGWGLAEYAMIATTPTHTAATRATTSQITRPDPPRTPGCDDGGVVSTLSDG